MTEENYNNNSNNPVDDVEDDEERYKNYRTHARRTVNIKNIQSEYNSEIPKEDQKIEIQQILPGWMDQMRQLQNQYNELKSNYEKVTEYSSKLQSSYKELYSQFEEYQNKVIAEREEYLKEINELKQLSNSAEEIKKEYNEYKKNTEIKLTECSGVEAELRKKVDFLEKTIAKFSEELEYNQSGKAEIDNKKLQNEINALNDKLKNEIENKDKEINDLVKQLDDAKMANVNNNDETELITGLKEQIEEVKKEKNEANDKIKELQEQIEKNKINEKQNNGDKKESDIIADYEDRLYKLNKEYISLKVTSLNDLYEKDVLLTKYKNIILSLSKKYKIQFKI